MPVTGGLFKRRYSDFGYWLPQAFKIGNRKNFAYARQVFTLRTAPTGSGKFSASSIQSSGGSTTGGARNEETGGKKERKKAFYFLYV